MMKRFTTGLSLLAAMMSFCGAAGVANAQLYETKQPNPQQEEFPRLVVVVSIDQFRGDYFDRFRKYFGNGGFQRLTNPGRMYENCYYQHANTITGPGHATMMTGTYAHMNGITANAWFDVAKGGNLYCVADPDAKFLTSDGVAGSEKGEDSAASPRALMAPTVGDVLETATGGKAKTVSISTKDRAAILMGGKSCDIAVWWRSELGEFVSSDYYGTEQPQWLKDFNKSKVGERWFKKSWELSLEPAAYEEMCTTDDFPTEGTGGYSTRTFPHVIGEKSEKPDKAYYDSLNMSPYANELIVDAAIAAMKNGEVGKDSIPDIMTLSFSCNDLIGHTFGPDSWEVMDATIKTDKTIERLLKALDDEVGSGRWTLFLTADHGVANFPEVLKERRIEAGRANMKEFREGIEKKLAEVYGPAPADKPYILSVNQPWMTLRQPENPGNANPDINRVVADYIQTLPFIAFADTTEALLHVPVNGDPLRQSFVYAHYPQRAGGVVFALKPYYYFSSGTGTTHGSPWRYDQFVPLFICGKGIGPGRSSFPVSPPQIAPTISQMLQIPLPAKCEVTAIPGALLNRM
ncbi:alkaline phosphatase family protein [Candidatus Sumerlaeota bacterium]|nr:alkaline phosphatase family protein [Candidatus Sumerlaeota bacterium]